MSYTLMGFGAAGLGSIDFSADEVWSYWLAGAPPKNDIAAGKLAADKIRAALSQIGYGPFQMGVMWGTAADKTEYGRAVGEQGIPPTPGMPSWWPNKDAMLKLQELVQVGDNVGGKETPEYHQVGNQIVQGKSPAQIAAEKKAAASKVAASANKAGMSTGTAIGIGVVALVALGGLAYFAKKKRAQQRPASSSSGSSGDTVTMVANAKLVSKSALAHMTSRERAAVVHALASARRKTSKRHSSVENQLTPSQRNMIERVKSTAIRRMRKPRD